LKIFSEDIEKVRSYGVQKSPSNLICGVLSPNGSLFSCHFVPVRRRSSLVSTSQSPFASWQERELFLYFVFRDEELVGKGTLGVLLDH